MGSKILIYLAVIISIFPIFWAVSTSFKEPADSLKPTVIPFVTYKPTIISWQREFTLAGEELRRDMTNSLVIAVFSTAIALLIGGLAGYSLSRFRFYRVKNSDINMWILSQIFIPPVVVVIPIFIMMQFLHILDTPLSLILAHTTFNIPIATLLMRDVFMGVPVDIEESAMVDGCSRLHALWKVVLPLCAPAVVSAAILCFSFSWNEFVFALTLSYDNATTIPLLVAGSRHTQGIQFGVLGVRSVLAILPPAIFAMFIQRYIVRGLTFGAIK